jgi:ketosteroid isomerase-like protein
MFFFILSAAMLFAACRPKTIYNDLNALRNIQDQTVNAVRTKDINKAMSMFFSDAIEMPPNEPIAIGIETIKKGWELWFSDTTYLHFPP